jgi:hypothetical protein
MKEDGDEKREGGGHGRFPNTVPGKDLYLTLPLVFPLESGGLPESHSSPGKVQHSGYSPGGIQWDYYIPTLVRSFPLDSRWILVGIQWEFSKNNSITCHVT